MRLWADFNDFDGEVIWTSLRRASFVPEGEPQIGQRIELWDHEGNVCTGVVTKVDDPIVYLWLDLNTWADAGTVQILEEYGNPAPSHSMGREDRTGIERLKLLAS